MPVHPTAIVDPAARIHDSAEIGPYAVIDGRVEVGAGTSIGPHVRILGRTTIGCGCRIHSGASIGDVPQDRSFTGAESFCRIGDETIIREGATVHRGTPEGSETVVGRRCFVMVNAHVGHNCRVGDDVILVNGALLGGYVEVGDRAVLSGNSAVHQFCRVGKLAMVGGLAKITRDIPPFCIAEQAGLCVGVNLVGLKRAGYAAEDRTEIKEAFRIIFRRNLSSTAAAQVLGDCVKSPAGREILEFLRAPSRRGITGGRARASGESVD